MVVVPATASRAAELLVFSLWCLLTSAHLVRASRRHEVTEDAMSVTLPA
jgi:hypothetical protein